MNIKLALQLFQNMGVRYTMYRVRHEVEKRSGLLKKKHPVAFAVPKISLEEWKSSPKKFVIPSREKLNNTKNPSSVLKENAEKILKGQILFFNSEWKELGLNYDWITNPSNGYRYDISKHWSEIPDLSEEAGDIKYVWEKSRFSYLLTLIRYDYHFDVDLSEFVFAEITSWIDQNPINLGPNWRCSQEISLRLFNWIYALEYYQNSEAFTEERWQKIQRVIYASLHHVYNHIDFSRIAVRNNHAITETLCLALSNAMFPVFPETKKWAAKGKKWFEQEIDYQIYDDGTFLQFSMNYHRVVVQLLSLALSMDAKTDISFNKLVSEKAYASVYFLYQCMQDDNGWLPNYGSNDGALFFPLADSDYRDYRPQLNTLHYILTAKDLFKDLSIKEDSAWLGIEKTFSFSALSKKQGCQVFEAGGYYLYRNSDYLTFIRCGNHKDRPAQADNLHLDLWHKGKNILRDSGTYKYNTDKEKLDYFMGSRSHNVVTVGEHSQMLKGSRFIWFFWTQKINANWKETDEEVIFNGEISAFRFLNPNASHKREIRIAKNTNEWVINDVVLNLDDRTKNQIWHPNDVGLHIESETDPVYFDSYNSNYYGQLKNEKSLCFEFQKTITTKIIYIS